MNCINLCNDPSKLCSSTLFWKHEINRGYRLVRDSSWRFSRNTLQGYILTSAITNLCHYS